MRERDEGQGGGSARNTDMRHDYAYMQSSDVMGIIHVAVCTTPGGRICTEYRGEVGEARHGSSISRG